MTLDEIKFKLTVPEQNIICAFRKNTLEETKENLIENLLLVDEKDFSNYGNLADNLKDDYKTILNQTIKLLEQIDENIFNEYILKLEIEEDIEEE